MISEGRAITTMPASYANVVRRIVANLATIPVVDAAPAVFTLLGREDHRNSIVEAFAVVAAEFSDGDPAPDPLAAGA